MRLDSCQAFFWLLKVSEQIALKWGAIDNEFIHIELSRVRNREKGGSQNA